MLDKARRMLTALVVVGLIGTVLTATPQPASALNGSQFDPGYIISDQNFYVRDAMSQDQIQAFLDAQVGNCRNSLCLNVLRVDTPTTTLSFGTCATYSGEAGESAARIIYKVQQACAISAKVLLVTLQKEQGLVTDDAPSASELRNALGQGCPDTAPCDSAYYGFFIQVFSAARQFAWYGNPDGSHTSIKVGQVNQVRFHPSTSCGSSSVTIQNRATAALYYYTPYQPNAAALSNLGGTGDGCSSYGNRNFWVYYNNWFGSPNSGGNPVAAVDILTSVPGGVRVAGWAFDPDTMNSIQVHIYVNGVGTPILASNTRTDVAAAYPNAGSAHGFDVTLKATTQGNQNVCIYGINQGPGSNVLFTCQDLPGATGYPKGVLDSVTVSPGAVTAMGWAFDPDTAASIPVHIYVDSAGTAVLADGSRSDVAQAYPGYGSQHGFSRTVSAAPGPHTVCAYGIESAGLGSNSLLGCKTVTVLGGSPIGDLEGVSVVSGTVTATGWAFDPETTASIPVHVYSDSSGVAGSAKLSRPDVATIYPGYGSEHGYSISFAATPGVHTVCAYGIDVASPGANQVLGCKTVTAMSGSPVGVIDSLSAANGRLSASGWAYDPDTAQPIPVHIYVDASGTPITAANERLDFAAVYSVYGPNHGYSLTTAITPGSHNVCVYAINVGPGSNVLLGCKVVTG